ESQHETVVVKRLRSLRRVDGRELRAQIEAGDLPFHAANADGTEHVIKGNADATQVRLVVPNTDAVKGVAVDQGDLDRVGAPAQFVELAGRAQHAPQPGESASQNQDSFGAHSLIPFRSWRMTGRDGMRRATVLNPARLNAEAVPVKMLAVLPGRPVSTGYA